MIHPVVQLVEAGRDLTMEQMAELIGAMMEGKWPEDEIARLLTALHRKGETTAEVAGAAAAMRRHMTRIRTRHTDVVDVVGTGGDASGTFNISTAAALVTAAVGVPVAKHGNRRFTSRSGSADVLVELGVNIEAGVARVEQCLDELGICFCFAPLLHQAMKHVAPVRKKLGTPTIFNMLGPLANPAGAPFQLLGVGRPALRPLLAEAVAMLGTRRTLVVHGSDGLDEVTLAGSTAVTEAAGGTTSEYTWTPDDFGLEPVDPAALRVEGPSHSAAVIRGILDGRSGGPRDIVIANAAAALWCAGRALDLRQCARMAAEAIQSGAARELLARLVVRTNSP
jgi:anthranilate phosphoribosyltransferase